MGPVVPFETASNDGVSEGEEVVEVVGVDGIAGREGASGVGAGALVGEDPEIELGEEAGEVGEGVVGGGGEGFDPERGAYVDWVLFEKRVRIFFVVAVVFLFIGLEVDVVVVWSLGRERGEGVEGGECVEPGMVAGVKVFDDFPH